LAGSIESDPTQRSLAHFRSDVLVNSAPLAMVLGLMADQSSTNEMLSNLS
jgi:hypothetical protein